MKDYSTKRCPYCAEKILVAAIFCKHCGRRVRGRYKRLLSFAVIIAMLTSLYLPRKKHIDFVARQTIHEVVSLYVSIRYIINELPESLRAIREYPARMKMIYELLEQKYSQKTDDRPEK